MRHYAWPPRLAGHFILFPSLLRPGPLQPIRGFLISRPLQSCSQLDQEERLAAEPPRLSKHRFQPMPLQVLTSDELAGSLRRLKPTAMLAKDRCAEVLHANSLTSPGTAGAKRMLWRGGGRR